MKAFLSIPLRILTHNIRYATDTPEPGEEVWSVRAPKLIGELKFHMRHLPTGIVCLQEVLHGQLEDIVKGLNVARAANLLPASVKAAAVRQDQRPKAQRQIPEQLSFLEAHHGEHAAEFPLLASDSASTALRWDYIGIGRDDGLTAGEYSPILYQPSIWKLLEKNTIWLSDTPDRPSKGWDAASPRILTVAVLKHREAEQKLVIMNTHLDDQGVVSRNQSAFLILETIAAYRRRHKSTPIVLAGDLNSETYEDAYKILAGSRSGLYDTKTMVPDDDWYGDNNTFTGFGHDTAQRIDFVFVADSPQWRVDGYAVASNRFDDGLYISDHRAVIADLAIIPPLY